MRPEMQWVMGVTGWKVMAVTVGNFETLNNIRVHLILLTVVSGRLLKPPEVWEGYRPIAIKPRQLQALLAHDVRSWSLLFSLVSQRGFGSSAEFQEHRVG